MRDAGVGSGASSISSELSRSQCIEWYREGQARSVEVAGVNIVVRFTGRKGRRARIAIVAPSGATFNALDGTG